MKNVLLGLAALGAAAAPALAQYPIDPALNLAVADGAFEEAQPKVVATSDGGCYVSWFASDPSGSPAFGYDVRLQRLNRAGQPEWPAGGILVADRGFSSTQDYGLAVDPSGNALLAFRDDRGVGTQITAAMVTPASLQLWGPTGVQLTSTTDFLAAPKICGTTDGHVIVAWTQNNTVRLQRLDALGANTWGSDIVLSSGGAFSLSDMHASDNGSAIFSFVSDSGSFGSPRELKAQKVSPAKVPLWGAGHVALLDSGSLQFGNFPTFMPDGAGGAVFAWYTSSPSLEVYAQRLDAAGNELFPHNGVAVSTDASQLRVGPSLAFDATEQELFVAYEELNSSQSIDGVSAQKFDAAGNRMWGASGLALQPLGGNDYGDVSAAELTVGSTDGLLVTYSDSAGFGQDQLVSQRVDDAGGLLGGTIPLSTTPAQKYRVTSRTTPFGHVVAVWQDDRSGSPGIFAQDVLPSGELGGAAGAVPILGSGTNPVALLSLTPPMLGHVWSVGVDKSANPGAIATAIFGYAAASAPVALPQGELLLDLTSPYVFVSVVAGPVTIDNHFFPVPGSIDLVGIQLACQAALVGGAGDLLTNGLQVTLGL
ncbi:MAG: hypothetical protein P1V81_05335 [Planctomycetota bacterium]|nr:hypothetical protein [Planctomycetota bacterium]